MSIATVLSVDVRAEASTVETEIEFLGKDYKLVQISVTDPADVQGAIAQQGTEVAAIAVSGIDQNELSLPSPATSGEELRAILQEWTVRHVNSAMPGYFLNSRVLTLLNEDCPDVERLLSLYTDNFIHWRANHPLADLSVSVMDMEIDVPLVDHVEPRIAWLTRKARRFVPSDLAEQITDLVNDASESRLGPLLKNSHVIVGGQEAVVDAGVDLAGKTFLGASISSEQVDALAALDIDLVVDCVPQPFPGITVNAATLDALILADKGSELTESDRLDAVGRADLDAMLHFPQGPRRTSRFAFVIHPLSQEYFRNVGAIDTLTKHGPSQLMDAVEKTMAHAPPFVYSRVTGVTSPTGARTEGWLITIGGTPKEILAHDPEFTYKRLLAAADMAKKMGAQIMGLGAFTKVVGDAGKTVAKRAPLPITTGNSYSASGALWALQDGILKLGIADVDPDGRLRGKSMVIGATGSIGSVCARLMAMASDELWLVSPESAKLLALKEEIELENPRAKIRVSNNADDHLPEMDAIVTATSAAGKKVVDIMRVKPGAVITDVARPLDLNAEDVAKRPDVLVVESGEIQLPGDEVRLGDLGLPSGVVFACLAETVVLALEGRFETFTVGREIEWPKVKEIYRLGLKHGMNLAAISGASGLYSDEDVAAIREAALAARDTWTPRIRNEHLPRTWRSQPRDSSPNAPLAQPLPNRLDQTMKSVLITGFPGFLGTALLPRVLARRPDQDAICLVQEHWRTAAEEQLQSITDENPDMQGRVQLVNGDITEADLGIPADVAANVDEVFHLAAVYDLTVPKEVARRVNVDGTRNIVEFCRSRDDFRRLQYVSTCYVSGHYDGTFYEDDLDVGQKLQNHYESTKFEAEGLVRDAIDSGLPASIYRPGVVVGDSQTGETHKFDGPYFLAHLLKLQPKVAVVPRVADPDEIVFSMVTRDFVVDGIDALSTADVAVGKTYALTDPNAPTVGRLVNTFARLLDRHFTWVPLPLPVLKPVVQIPGVESVIGVPAESLDYFAFPTKYDTSNATEDLAELGIRCPSFDEYAPNLIRFFLDHPEISSSAMT